MSRVDRIRTLLDQAFAPDTLDIEDQSHLHVGHAGAASGRGHFHVNIVSARFRDMTPLQRHRAVYAALGELMQTDIHALSLSARAPGDAASV